MKMFLYEKEVYPEASVLASQNLNHLFIINKLFWTNYFELFWTNHSPESLLSPWIFLLWYSYGELCIATE